MVDHDRFTPETGYAITDVLFTVDFVRYTPESGLKTRWAISAAIDP